jgi:hypothetical protein
MKTKPKVQLIGENGNIFAILGRCSKVLKREGQEKEAKEMSGKVFASKSYEEALSIITDYVEVE